MDVRLEMCTKQLEQCRHRWNSHSLDFVLESAAILARAQVAAQNKRRWVRWLRSAAHMHPGTAYRHLRVARFLKGSFALKRKCATLSLSKVYALSRTKPLVAQRLCEDEKVRSMTDANFAKFIRQYLPPSVLPPTKPNLFRSVMAGLTKARRGIERWKNTRIAMPMEFRSRILLRLREVTATLSHLRTYRKRAL